MGEERNSFTFSILKQLYTIYLLISNIALKHLFIHGNNHFYIMLSVARGKNIQSEIITDIPSTSDNRFDYFPVSI